MQFVKRIPPDIRNGLVGRELLVPLGADVKPVRDKIGPKTQSIRFSLQTSDPSATKIGQASAAAYVEEVLASLRGDRPTRLSREQVTALAGELYRELASTDDDEQPVAFIESNGEMVRSNDYDPLDDEVERIALEQQAERLLDMRDAGTETLEATLGPVADKLLASKSIMRVDERTRVMFANALPRALADGMQARAKRLGGDFGPDDAAERFPDWVPPAGSAPGPRNSGASKAEKVSLTGLVDLWWIEAQAAGKSESTHESYSNSFRLLSAFLGHDDATKVIPEDVIRFKDHRLTTPNPKTGRPVSAKTVKASDLTAFKSVFDWAVANRKLTDNPASGVTIRLGKTVKVRERDFTDGEAGAILAKADKMSLKSRLSETDAMKRWVPWLCAYSGARLGEMVQLRKEDLRREGDDGLSPSPQKHAL